MSRLGSSTNRWLTWFHRWAGVVLCLFFAMWFASGAGLHFVGFPSLPNSEQRASSEQIGLNDADRPDLYVRSRTGEVVQRTRFGERMWNWVGAVVHWIYFTPLRKSWSAWNQTVWWLSFAALLSSGVGTWLGLLRMVSNRAAGRRGLSPFRGWMRWHHVIGLFASVIVVAWIFSGWLSMDHGRLFSHGEASATEVEQLRGMSLEAIADSASLDLLAQLPPSTSIGFNALARRAFIATYGPLPQAQRIILADQSSSPALSLLPDALLQAPVP